MSTEDTNKVVVTLQKGVDVDAFMQEMNSVGSSSPHVPDRAVEIYNEKPESMRNVDFVMTREEAQALKNDPRVLDARYGTKAENGIVKIRMASTANMQMDRASTWVASGNTDANWGLARVNSTTNNITTGLTTPFAYTRNYTLTGNGADVVIMDSGIQADHPEWLAPDGVTSRFQRINWFATGFPTGNVTGYANAYTDNNGHGTNVTSIATGRTYGWASESNIYCINILGEYANGQPDLGAQMPVDLSINRMRAWHQAKTPTSTGFVRPTIMNNSWGYGIPVSYITQWRNVNYRGTSTSVSSYTSALSAYGIVSLTGYSSNDTIPTQVSSTDADIQDAIDAGVIVMVSGGNDAYKMDVVGGTDYNNYITADVQGYTETIYYQRGNSPASAYGSVTNRPIVVGAVSRASNVIVNQENKTNFSKTGPGVQVYAPGDYIAGACSTTSNLGSYPKVNYPTNSSFRSIKVSGTSQASPQVAGWAATIMAMRPWLNQAQLTQYMNDVSVANVLNENSGGGTGYTNFYYLQGGTNRYMYNPFSGSTVTTATLGSDGTTPTVIRGQL